MINTLLEAANKVIEVTATNYENIKENNGAAIKFNNSLGNTVKEKEEKENIEEEDDDEEEDEVNNEILNVEQEVTMLISSGEVAELEAERIRFLKKRLRKKSQDSRNNCSTTSSNSNISFSSSSKENNIHQSLRRNSNNFENSTLNREQRITNDNLKENQQIPGIDLKIQQRSSPRLRRDLNKNIENLSIPISSVPPGDIRQTLRRQSNMSTCSVASSIVSDSSEKELCGNIYIYLSQQIIIFNCEFCKLKYKDLENLKKHLHESHRLFMQSQDEENVKKNSPRIIGNGQNIQQTIAISQQQQQPLSIIKKEPLHSPTATETVSPDTALELDAHAEQSLQSCGNVFILNNHKLFLICGYCEGKYANKELFEKHLRQHHDVFDITPENVVIDADPQDLNDVGENHCISKNIDKSLPIKNVQKEILKAKDSKNQKPKKQTKSTKTEVQNQIEMDQRDLNKIQETTSIEEKEVPKVFEKETTRNKDDNFLMKKGHKEITVKAKDIKNLKSLGQKRSKTISGIDENKSSSQNGLEIVNANKNPIEEHINIPVQLVEKEIPQKSQENIDQQIEVHIKVEEIENKKGICTFQNNGHISSPKSENPSHDTEQKSISEYQISEDLIFEDIPDSEISSSVPSLSLVTEELQKESAGESRKGKSSKGRSTPMPENKETSKSLVKRPKRNVSKVMELQNDSPKAEIFPTPNSRRKTINKKNENNELQIQIKINDKKLQQQQHLAGNSGESFISNESITNSQITNDLTSENINKKVKKEKMEEKKRKPKKPIKVEVEKDTSTQRYVKPVINVMGERCFACDQCPRAFKKHANLMEHKRIHTGEKPFECDECGKQFRYRVRLNEHKLRHSKERKFICEICNLGCCTKQDLNMHMRHHNNDRRHKCTVCPKAFVRRADLKIHIRVHTGEKPYVCDICHKCFRANQNLSVHRKSHMGEASKNFKCEFCEKKFMRNLDRKMHMRSHTGERPFKCEICGLAYSSRANVRAHIERDHVPANGVGTPPRGKKKPGPKPRDLKEELEKQRKLIEELQAQLKRQIKTDEVIIPDDHCLNEDEDQQSLMETNETNRTPEGFQIIHSPPLVPIPSPPCLDNPYTKEAQKKLPIIQKMENHGVTNPATPMSLITTVSPQKPTTTKVVSQQTSLGIQQVSVTVSMQVENVPTGSPLPEKENSGISNMQITAKSVTPTSTTTTSIGGGPNVKKERKNTNRK